MFSKVVNRKEQITDNLSHRSGSLACGSSKWKKGNFQEIEVSLTISPLLFLLLKQNTNPNISSLFTFYKQNPKTNNHMKIFLFSYT